MNSSKRLSAVFLIICMLFTFIATPSVIAVDLETNENTIISETNTEEQTEKVIPTDDPNLTEEQKETEEPTAQQAPVINELPSMTENVIVQSNSSNSIDLSSEAVDITNLDDYGFGDYSLELQTEDASALYNVYFGVSRIQNDGKPYNPSNEVYKIEVYNADGTLNADLSQYYKFSSAWSNAHNRSELAFTLNNVPSGSTVVVKDIIVEQKIVEWGTAAWDNFKLSYMSASVKNADPNSDEVVLIEAESKDAQLIVGETISQVAKAGDSSFDRKTEDTLLSLSNKYTSYYDQGFLTYLLSSYNVISLDEINATHIVGPIISQNIAERTYIENSEVGFLAAADYTAGVPSYVGEFTTCLEQGKLTSGVRFTYNIDITQDPYFKQPFAYSEEDRLSIKVKGDVNNAIDYYVLNDGVEFISANQGGQVPTYQNNNFIDFNDFATALGQASDYIASNGNAESYPEQIKYEFDTNGTVDGSTIKIYDTINDKIITITANNGETYTNADGQVRGFSDFVQVASKGSNDGSGIRLTINMEESWNVLNAPNLHEVNMILPDDYDFTNNPYMLPTTINFDCEYVNPKDYIIDLDGDGIKETTATHSRFPMTLIDGEEFKTEMGQDAEYGEVGNKIIWNMPNVETNSDTGENRLSTIADGQNIAGHIVAPGAEFWNYKENGGWQGGNLNGTAIFKSFYSGTMEIHKWAYTGLAEKAVVYGVTALKTVNGAAPQRKYNFLLDVEPSGTIPDGVLNKNFPMSSTSSIESGEEGLIEFSSLVFDKAGTYSFVVYEDTSMDTPTDNIDYDLTKYRIDITVGSTTDAANLTTYTIDDVKKYKIAERDGTPIEPTLSIPEVSGKHEFTFDNLTTTEETVSLKFIKQSTTGHLLQGAKFYLTEMTSATDTTKPSGGYFEKTTSDEKGNIIFDGLKKDTYYKLEEYEAPNGHIKPDGYWIVHIGPNGFLLSVEAKDGAPEINIDDDIIYNELEEENSLDLSLTKKNQMNTILSGVPFRLQRVIVDKDGVPNIVANGFDEVYQTDDSGKIHISGLLADHVYMLTETATPEHHVEHTGYWLIEVKGNQAHPSEPLTYTIVEYDKNNKVVGEVTDDTIYNEKIEFKLPTTGGMGKEIFYIIGIALMTISFVIYRRKSIK